MSYSTESYPMPPPDLRFRRRIGLVASLRELWQAREVVRALVERQLRARYKQALLGFGWAVIPPVLLMIVFSVFVQRVVNIPTGDVPYPLFSYVALVPWTFFASSVSGAGGSIVGSLDLINKVYSPRETFPLSCIVTAGVDAVVGLVVLAILFALYTFPPKVTALWVPLLVVVQLAFTVGVSVIIAGFVVYLRDLRYALPLIIQLGLFATPVAYGIDQIPASMRVIYSALNPLAPVIDGYRRVVLYGQQPAWDLVLAGAVTSFVVLVVGLLSFKRLETGFADVT